jgi:glutamate racemase
VKRHIDALLEKDPQIDTLILGCTHYPLLEKKIRQYLPERVTLLSQGEYVAERVADYLHRHPEIETRCSQNHTVRFYTTEAGDKFASMASIFLQNDIRASRIVLESSC